MQLGWDIVELIRGGQDAEAIRELAAQRRISLDDARKTISAWRWEHIAGNDEGLTRTVK
jgi:hypothetical protein